MKNIKTTCTLTAAAMLAAIALSGCAAAKTDAKGEQKPAQTKEVPESTCVSKKEVEWVYYETLGELVDESDVIVSATVVKRDKSEYVDEKEAGDDNDELTEYIPFHMNVNDVYKGDVCGNDDLLVRQCTALYDEEDILQEGETYLFFLENDETDETLFILKSPIVGFSKINDEKVESKPGNSLWKDSISLDKLEKKIKAKVK